MRTKKQIVSAHPQTRELTPLEYVILGFLAIKPQSGYDIINNFELGVYRASASTGSIYPVLKRLEKLELIGSTLEVVYETRPRKVYTLRPAGEQLLDEWLRRPPSMQEVIEEYDIAMHKFLVAEYRLSRAEVLEWLDAYEQVVTASLALRSAIIKATRGEGLSLHAQLINRAMEFEIDARLAWIKDSQARLRSTL
ncbi:MAG TPA: PadR family transcriptional regulator [Aggregatilineales bacterium]|nr:PadR family transcriptional regulator [Aggregatilineales bacterium]